VSRQALAYVYFEDEPGQAISAKLRAKDKVRRIAANLPNCQVLLATGAKP